MLAAFQHDGNVLLAKLRLKMCVSGQTIDGTACLSRFAVSLSTPHKVQGLRSCTKTDTAYSLMGANSKTGAYIGKSGTGSSTCGIVEAILEATFAKKNC